jgi:hypothetical protein
MSESALSVAAGNASARGTIGVAAAAYHLPGPPIDIVPWAQDEGVPPALIERLLANGCRYFYEGPQYSDAELIIGAIDRLEIADTNWLAGVRYLLHAHTQSFSMPAPPSSILSELARHYDLHLSLSFSVCQIACASVINAIDIAARLLVNDAHAEYALVVTSDRVFGNAKHRIRQDAGIQSDGGSAIVLAKQHVRCRLGPASFKNFAALHDGPTTPANIAAIGRYTWLHTKLLFQDHSALSGLALGDYGRILPINADRHYWVEIARALQLPESRFFLDNIRERGHACCADLAVNLVDHGLAIIERGKPVLACGQSNVGAYAALSFLPVSVAVTAREVLQEVTCN